MPAGVRAGAECCAIFALEKLQIAVVEDPSVAPAEHLRTSLTQCCGHLFVRIL